jgi:trk system potassium uptake protein TrkA
MAQIVVVGLGRFGGSVARTLAALGHDVLAIDRDEARVNDIAEFVTRAVQLDASDDEALGSIGAEQFDTAVVAIGSDPEASIFATMALRELGVGRLVARAGSRLHATILSRVGADAVVNLEESSGARIARSLGVTTATGYLEVAGDLGIVVMPVPAAYVGRTLDEIDLEKRVGVTPIVHIRAGRALVNPATDVPLAAEDQLVLVGPDNRLERVGH